MMVIAIWQAPWADNMAASMAVVLIGAAMTIGAVELRYRWLERERERAHRRAMRSIRGRRSR